MVVIYFFKCSRTSMIKCSRAFNLRYIFLTIMFSSFRLRNEASVCVYVTHMVSSDAKISEVNLSAFIYRLFHEDFSSIIGATTCNKGMIQNNKRLVIRKGHVQQSSLVRLKSMERALVVFYTAPDPFLHE